MTVAEPIGLAWCGPVRHGISQLAVRIGESAQQQGFRGPVLAETDPNRLAELADRIPAGISLLHLHANDWLFSTGRGRGAARLVEFAQVLRQRGTALAVTLHDLPQPMGGTALDQSRAIGYARITAACAGVAVCSDHERVLLERCVGWLDGCAAWLDAFTAVEVIPLPIDRQPVDPLPIDPLPIDPDESRIPDGLRGGRSVGIFGFLYPGKGHREVLAELAGMSDPPTVLAIGAVSPGHEGLVGELTEWGRQHRVPFAVTGYLADDQVPTWLRQVGVPVAAHTRVSASASINSWIAAGRRPLVPAGPYTDELQRRLPGAVSVYGPGELRQRVEDALADPEVSWLPAGFRSSPNTAEVARRYLTWLRRLAADLPIQA